MKAINLGVDRKPWIWGLALVFLIFLGIGRIVLTYSNVSQTIDENTHIFAGLEWLDKKTYQYNQENPPLSRVAVAIGPYLGGAAVDDPLGRQDHKNASGSSYFRTLVLARLGTLPFFIAAVLVVWFWSVHTFGRGTAIIATALFSFVPPILAHAGLATTDMAATATVAGAIFALILWLEEPSKKRSAILGLALGLALLTKFSAIPFLIVSALVIFAARWLLIRKSGEASPGGLRRILSGMIVSIVAAGFIVWAGYQFSFGPIRSPENRPNVFIDHVVSPAPELLGGIGMVAARSWEGKTTYALGETSDSGFWYFYPIAFALKTPLPLILMFIVGSIAIVTRAWRDRRWQSIAPFVGGLAIITAMMPGAINIGLRHILPVYPLVCIVAAAGITRIVESTVWRHLGTRLSIFGLFLWFVVSSFGSHPAYLSYFNELVGAHPEEFLVDSDLDWGQDVGRLADELKSRNIRNVSLALFTAANFNHFEWPEQTSIFRGSERATGWIAASMFRIKVSKEFAWLEAYEPVTTVGGSIRLYNIPEVSNR